MKEKEKKGIEKKDEKRKEKRKRTRIRQSIFVQVVFLFFSELGVNLHLLTKPECM